MPQDRNHHNSSIVQGKWAAVQSAPMHFGRNDGNIGGRLAERHARQHRRLRCCRPRNASAPLAAADNGAWRRSPTVQLLMTGLGTNTYLCRCTASPISTGTKPLPPPLGDRARHCVPWQPPLMGPGTDLYWFVPLAAIRFCHFRKRNEDKFSRKVWEISSRLSASAARML